jgi:hypothetical protein
MTQVDDLSRSLDTFDQDTSLTVVVEMSAASWKRRLSIFALRSVRRPCQSFSVTVARAESCRLAPGYDRNSRGPPVEHYAQKQRRSTLANARRYRLDIRAAGSGRLNIRAEVALICPTRTIKRRPVRAAAPQVSCDPVPSPGTLGRVSP